MRNHILNLFSIQNLADLNFSYRLAEFDLPIVPGQEDKLNKQLQKIALKVASLSGGPTAIIQRNGRFYVAIPQDRSFPDSVVNVVPMNVKVRLLEELHHLRYDMIDDDNIEIVQKFLDFEIRRQLGSNQLLWKLNSSQFFLKAPKAGSDDSSIGIYEGFSYKLIRTADRSFAVCLDLSTKYIDKQPLSRYVNTRNSDAIGMRYKGRRCLYLNGDNWYAVEIAGFGESVSNHEFLYEGKERHVYEYILESARSKSADVKRVLKDTDITLLYKYPGRSMEPHCGASSLARILYNTHDKEVQSLHRLSIKQPGVRFDAIQSYISQFFSVLDFNGTAIRVSMAPAEERIRNFSFPELRFNNGNILKVGNLPASGQTKLRDFAAERKKLIEQNGVLTRTIFDEQFLVVPDYMDRKLVEAFKRNAEAQIKKLAPMFDSFRLLRYKVQRNFSTSQQMQEIEQVLTKHNALDGFALFILPDEGYETQGQVKNFHDFVKNQFYPDLKVQCASLHMIKGFFHPFPIVGDLTGAVEYRVREQDRGKFRSYLFNLVLKHLIVNRKWPFSLNRNLNCDIYIGIDVHDRFAGFTFFFKNGEKIFFFPEAVPQKNRSQRAEKLKAQLLFKMIYEQLSTYIPEYAPNPNGIVIIRDGRSFGEEEIALSQVIDKLNSHGLLDATRLKWGVVDLHKQSAVPLRIASETNSYEPIENPMAGAYKLMNKTEGFLYNTGYPFKIRGSAKPLHLSLKAGNVDFLKVIEDVFCQSILAYSAPDKSSSLPVSIKLIDTLLEPLATSFEESEEVEEEFEDSIIEEI